MTFVGCAGAERAERRWLPESAPQAPRSVPGDPRVEVPDATRTIAQVLPELRRCFEHLDATGKVALQLTIDGGGHVAAARGSGAVPRDVIHCVERKIRTAHFSCPEGGRYARLDVSVRVLEQ